MGPEYICRGAGQGIGEVRVNAKAYCQSPRPHLHLFQEPCSHAYAFILFFRRRPATLSTETWQSTYAKNLQPLDISEAAETDVCKPPPTKLRVGKEEEMKKACMEDGQHRQNNEQVTSRCSNVMKRAATRGAVFAVGRTSNKSPVA